MEFAENQPQSEVMNKIEMIAMDIIADTPFQEYPDVIDDPEAWEVTGPATMASFKELIKEAKKRAENREQLIAIVEVFFKEYLQRHEALFLVKFEFPDPYINWIKDNVDRARQEFYRNEVPSKLDLQYEHICKMMSGEVPDFGSYTDEDEKIKGMPLQVEVEAFFKMAETLNEDELVKLRTDIQENDPEYWQAINNFVEASGALFSAHCEAREKWDLGKKFKYLVKERIQDLEWQKIAAQAEDLKQQLKDLGIDLDKDQE